MPHDFSKRSQAVPVPTAGPTARAAASKPSRSNAEAQDLLREASAGPGQMGMDRGQGSLGGEALLAQMVGPQAGAKDGTPVSHDSKTGSVGASSTGSAGQSSAADPFGHLPPSLFGVGALDPKNLAVTAFPVGQAGLQRVLHVYEQTRPLDKGGRPVFAKSGDSPTMVDPLLANFDFAKNKDGARYTDSNGYSVRVGDKDLPYRMVLERSGEEWVLIARPNREGDGPEMVVGRSGGDAAGPVELKMEPGWQPMRRQYQGKNIGHVTFQRKEAP